MIDQRNPVGWFEIYVTDLERAKRFYETVFQVELQPLPTPADDIEMLMFPGDPQNAGCCGALARMEGCTPGGGGTIVYFSCRDCGEEEGRVEGAGGNVVKPKFTIGPYGFISLVTDPDGNMIGLHNPAEGGGC